MKALSLLVSLLFSSSVFADMKSPPHLDLEMTSQEYRSHLKKIKLINRSSLKSRQDDPAITYALHLGTRLSKWITLVNETRTTETAIRLTSAATRRGIPIDQPSVYSPSLIKTRLQKVLAEMPNEMREVIVSNNDLPTTLPLDDETFIKHGRLLDRQYQSAARFKSIDNWRSYYIGAAVKDVRGYYYLTSNKITENELRDVSVIPAEKVEPIKDALAKICLNAKGNLDKCQKAVNKAFTQNQLAQFYSTHISAAKRNWDNFFVIPRTARRRDIKWNGNVATVPFNTPSIPKFLPYLQNNIEDEFRFGDWGLEMVFGTFPNGPVLIFQPNVVPHVNGLGGNEIVMDSNQSIEEYESQWTIRHEFGHVLGLPDCYHEFYDTTQKAYVNYQLDITDLMCSRAGNMKERIYLELKEAYAH